MQPNIIIAIWIGIGLARINLSIQVYLRRNISTVLSGAIAFALVWSQFHTNFEFSNHRQVFVTQVIANYCSHYL